MAECGEPTASTKFVNAAFVNTTHIKDPLLPSKSAEASAKTFVKNAKYFEFKNGSSVPGLAATNDWLAEFKANSAGGQVLPVTKDDALEALYERQFNQYAIRPSVESGGSCPWAKEFAKVNLNSSIPNTVANANENLSASDWKAEYLSQHREHETAETWISEFTSYEQVKDDPVEMARSAAELLNALDLSDKKLADSKFVAYLKMLTQGTNYSNSSGCPVLASPTNFEHWKQQYMENISDLINDDNASWMDTAKDWEKYASTGLGYAEFASDRLSTYNFSVPIGINPYRNMKDAKEFGLSLLNSQGFSKNVILALEAHVHANPRDADGWYQLGLVQQRNEMDIQAIAALVQATKLSGESKSAWIALAASCANENCIPDAINYLDKLLRLYPNQYQLHQMEGFGPSRLASLTRAFAKLASEMETFELFEALGILYAITGSHQQATQALENAILLDPNNFMLQSRYGACLANCQRYQDAIKVYDGVLVKDNGIVRVHFNRGISMMCLGNYQEAASSIIQALSYQQPVDVVEGIHEEMVSSYTAVWDTLAVICEMLGRTDLVGLCEQRDINGVKRLIH